MRSKESHAKPRRIIVHTPEPSAGAGQYVAEFVGGLAAQGEHVELFCPANFSYSQDVLDSGAKIISAPRREVAYAYLVRRVLRNTAFAVCALKAFRTTVKRGDVVHFQFALHLGLGLLFFLVARLKGASIVLTVHDPLPHRWIFPRWFHWLEVAFLSIGYAQCHKLIVHNRVGQRILVDQFHVDPDDVAVIPHGALNLRPENHVPENHAPETKVENRDPLRLLLFGSMRENKGIDLAISAVQKIRQTENGRPVILTVAGRTPNLMEAAYWDHCKELIQAAPAGIEVIDRVIPDGDIPSLFARHDAVLLPYTRFFSDSGVAMLALAQSRPIVATDAGGLGELLRAADCGILIESADVASVVAAIETARALPADLLRNKGWNGHSYVSQSRSWKSIAAQTQNVYNDLLRPRAKVVMHSPEPASSASLYLEAISKALAAEGVPVTVVCPANLQALPSLAGDPSITVKTCCARGIQTKVSVFTKIWENLRFVLSSAWTLLHSTKRGDIVHLQYILHLPFGLIFLLCAWLRGARIVFTVHDPLPHKFLFPRFLKGLEMAALRLAYQWSDSLIVHSEAGKQKLVDVFCVPSQKIRVIVHGPYELKQPVKKCTDRKRLEVLFFGSLRENKAPHLAIQAVQQLAAEGAAIRLTIAGQVVNRKEQEYWAQCRTLIDARSGTVRLIQNFVPDEELPELFSNCHCFILPYTAFSSDSGVAYMALANAKPIVSTGAGGLGWLLTQSGGGIMISESTLPGVVDALRKAIDLGPDQLAAMGQTGADWVLAHCGWPTVARETRNLYAQWLDHLRPEPARAEAVGVAAEPMGALP